MQPFPEPLAAVLPDALPALCRRYGVKRLDVFGSAATGRFDPERSDFDFLVSFNTSPQVGSFKAYIDFHEALTGLLGRDVDLLTEPGIRNPYLRREIAAERRQLFP